MSTEADRLRVALADRYTLERELGRGGMATVYLARDLKHDRRVALKVLRPELAAALGAERFLQEIRTTAQLAHPHILPLHDSGEAVGFLYYTMPFVEGESLRARLDRERQLPLEDALQVTREVADALGYAHALGIVHRDIKPENILFQGGHAVVADFGIAKAVSAAGATTLTETGLVVGTPAYMSPEQAAGNSELDGRSDLYSLGCVLYEMLSGETPYTGSTPMAILAQKLSEPVPRVSLARERVPAPIEAALERVLAKAPADRFATAHDFATALALDPAMFRRRHRGKLTYRRAALGAGLVLAAVAGTWGIRAVLARRAAEAPPEDPAAIPIDSTAIAVLPFRVVGADSTGVARTLANAMGDLFEMKVSTEFGRRVRYPGSVFQEWRRAGGTPDSALPETVELAVARAVGAGRLVRGTIFVTGDSLVVSASMLQVPGGAIRAATGRVDGTVERQQDLVDQVVSVLLAGDVGMSPERAPQLARFRTEAVQAYIASLGRVSWAQKRAYLSRALALDSNLVDAAFGLYDLGEQLEDSAVLRYAWEHRDQLTGRKRAYLAVMGAGLVGPVQTVAARLAGYADLVRRWPEWRVNARELGVNLTLFGPLTGDPDWESRAQALLWPFARGSGLVSGFLIQFALMHEDTVRALDLLEEFKELHPRFAREWPIGLALEAAYDWYMALLRGDTAAAWRLLEADSLVAGELTSLALMNGRGLSQIDRVIARHPYPLPMWGWVRGRADFWQAPWGDLDGGPSPVARTGPRVYWALLLGPTADDVVAADLRSLEAMAAGRGDVKPTPDEQAVARCWVALWRLSHGDTTGAADVIRFLRTEVDRPFRFAGWAGLLEAMRTELVGGDVRTAVFRLDSLMREVPLTKDLAHAVPALGEHEVGMPFTEVHNLFTARLLARLGEPKRALAAVRRRDHMSLALSLSLPEFLREEGRLAAKTGDTAGAVRAYRHFLALREDPDPPWRASWDSVRTELAALVAR